MAPQVTTVPGDRDVEAAAAELAAPLPPAPALGARAAYDRQRTWAPEGVETSKAGRRADGPRYSAARVVAMPDDHPERVSPHEVAG